MREQLISQLAQLPAEVEALVDGLTDAQLTARPVRGEWSIAQNVHHLVDSHVNSYVRCKLIATEVDPTFRLYDEGLWAELPDGREPDLGFSLPLLHALHGRWVRFFDTLGEEAWMSTGLHPDSGPVTLEGQIGLYVDHGNAHLDQIGRVQAAL